jgi:branched-subunit amino acid ABC-type transport system permease component
VLFTGISLGSILLLVALGLAITYGLMGVINMAHGELMMIGAYATYVVQNLFKAVPARGLRLVHRGRHAGLLPERGAGRRGAGTHA